MSRGSTVTIGQRRDSLAEAAVPDAPEAERDGARYLTVWEKR